MTKQQVLVVLKTKYFVLPVVILFVVIIVIGLYYSRISDEIILPDDSSYRITGYTDAVDGGNTEIIEEGIKDSAFYYRFQLKKGFVSPYAGFSIYPLRDKYIDATQFNRIQFCLKAKGLDRLGIGVYTVSNYSEVVADNESLYHSYLDVSDEKVIYSISIDELKHPEWWEDLYQINEINKKKPDLSKILHINIGSAYSPDLNEPKDLILYSIIFSRNNNQLFLWLGSSYCLFVLVLFMFSYFKIFAKKKVEEITVSYKPVEFEKSNSNTEQKCVDFINTNFQNSELSLELVANETGVSQRRITNVINEQFRCNFKTYINRIRINEAHRLLSQTDLNMGEIAYKVGFNNQSHFNRVFKAETAMSPSEYRDNQS
nr:AraC family transcriptional regulator [uncultured Carboxylicivirga sp.]